MAERPHLSICMTGSQMRLRQNLSEFNRNSQQTIYIFEIELEYYENESTTLDMCFAFDSHTNWLQINKIVVFTGEKNDTKFSSCAIE